MRYCGMMAVAALWAGAIVSAGDEKTSDLDRMQGTWGVVTLVERGKAIPEDKTKPLTIVVAGDRLTINEGGKAVSDYKFKLDPKQKPKTIDMTITEGEDKGKVAPGIYVLDGDTLKISADEDLKKRPASFDEKETKTCSVITLKRKKKE